MISTKYCITIATQSSSKYNTMYTRLSKILNCLDMYNLIKKLLRL